MIINQYDVYLKLIAYHFEKLILQGHKIWWVFVSMTCGMNLFSSRITAKMSIQNVKFNIERSQHTLKPKKVLVQTINSTFIVKVIWDLVNRNHHQPQALAAPLAHLTVILWNMLNHFPSRAPPHHQITSIY